jgi:hypothetical protein
MQGDKNLDFTARDHCKPVLLRLSLDVNLKKTSYIPLWDQMEGAWLWTQRRYDMNGRSQMQGGKSWILPKEIDANRFF